MTNCNQRYAIAVDYGGVLTNPISKSLEALARTTSISPMMIQNALRDAAEPGDVTVMAALERGQLTLVEGFSRVMESLPGEWEIPIEDISNLWLAGRTPNEEMKEAVTRLGKREDVITVVATNNVREWENHWRDTIAGVAFDHEIVSCDIGSRKPEAEFYRRLIETSNLPPGDIFFVDDVQENVDAARELGIEARLFTGVAAFTDAALQWLARKSQAAQL